MLLDFTFNGRTCGPVPRWKRRPQAIGPQNLNFSPKFLLQINERVGETLCLLVVLVTLC